MDGISTTTTTDVSDAPANDAVSTPDVSSDASSTQNNSILSNEPTGDFDVNTIIESNGNFKEGWTKALGDPDLAESKVLQQFKDIHGLVKSLDHSQRMMGKKVISPKDMDDDTKAQFMKEWGVPDDPKEYGFKAPEDIPEGFKFDEKGLEWAADTFKELGIPKDMAQKLVEKHSQYQLDMVKDQITQKADADAQRIVEAEKALKDKYGQDYDKVITKARLTVESLTEMGVNDVDFIDLNNPKAVEWLYNMSERLGEDKIVSMDSSGGDSKAAMTYEYEDLLSNPDRVNPDSADFRKLNRRFEDLGKKLYPGMVQV